MLNFCKIRGTLHLGRSNLGNVKPTLDPEEGSQALHKLLTKTHREIEEEHKLERALQLPLQCHWVHGKVTSKTILIGKLLWQCHPIYYLFV